MLPRIAVRAQRNQVNLFLLYYLIERRRRMVTGNEMGLNVNALQLRTRLHLFEIMPGFFSIPRDNTIG